MPKAQYTFASTSSLPIRPGYDGPFRNEFERFVPRWFSSRPSSTITRSSFPTAFGSDSPSTLVTASCGVDSAFVCFLRFLPPSHPNHFSACGPRVKRTKNANPNRPTENPEEAVHPPSV